MSKRIHELAKEWNVQPKDLLAGLEKLAIRGKRSQSSLTDEEVQLTRAGLLQVDRLLPTFFEPRYRGSRYT